MSKKQEPPPFVVTDPDGRELFRGTSPDLEIERKHMQKGTVVKAFPERGFAFITPDSGGQNIFAHVRQVRRGALTEGARVSFEIRDSPRGPTADNITVEAQ